jgi:hypothetical protein
LGRVAGGSKNGEVSKKFCQFSNDKEKKPLRKKVAKAF